MIKAWSSLVKVCSPWKWKCISAVPSWCLHLRRITNCGCDFNLCSFFKAGCAMDPAPIYHQAHKYIETASGNKVSKLSTLAGSQNIILNGKTIIMEGCILRGDLATLKIGKNSIIREGAILRPPFKKFAKGVAFFPLHMGEWSKPLVSAFSMFGS